MTDVDDHREDQTCSLENAERLVRIRALNDAMRTAIDSPIGAIVHGQLRITRGIAARSDAFFLRALEAVRTFKDFEPENDPHGEHDFGSFVVDGKKLFWKIDYYDQELEYGSPDPSDAAATKRVLTIMLAEEY